MTIQTLCNIFGFKAKTSIGNVSPLINNRADRRRQRKNKK